MIIFPSIGLGWLFPIGKKNRANNNIGGPYFGAGLGVGFPFFTRVSDAQRKAHLQQKAAGRRKPASRSASKNASINDPWERKALYWMLAPLVLVQTLATEGVKGGRAITNGLGGIAGGLKSLGKGAKNAGKAYGNFVTTRRTDFTASNQKPFTMKSQETRSVSPAAGGAHQINRASLEDAVSKQMKSVDRQALETPGSRRQSMGVK